jgi:hypothetical protein
MEDYSAYIDYYINGVRIDVLSINTDYGFTVLAEIDNNKYYLGEGSADISAAILAYQLFTGKTLSPEERAKIIELNSEEY